MAEKDNVRTPTIAIIGVLSAILVFAIIVLLQVIYYWNMEAQQQSKVLDQVPQQLSDLTNGQRARLAEYRWVDEKKGRVTIPIDRAMRFVVDEVSTEQSDWKKGEGT